MTPGAGSGRPAVASLDDALERARHATSGLYGARVRGALLARAGWDRSVVHYRLLRTVQASEPGRPSVDELAAALLTDKARASRLVDETQTAGLVRRRIGVADRRRREVELTDHGREALADVGRVRRDMLAAATSGWQDRDIAHLSELLDQLNSAVRDVPALVVGVHPVFRDPLRGGA